MCVRVAGVQAALYVAEHEHDVTPVAPPICCMCLFLLLCSPGSPHALSWRCVQLGAPVFHVGFMPEVVKMLQSVCFHCAKFRSHDRQARLELLQEPCGKRRLTKASLLCKDLVSCSGKEGKGIVAVGCNYLQVV